MMADPLLAQSAMDRLRSGAYELVVDGEAHSPRNQCGRVVFESVSVRYFEIGAGEAQVNCITSMRPGHYFIKIVGYGHLPA